MNTFPIIDLHCDLLTYLAHGSGATIFDTDEIGVALPHLKAGNVTHQVLAIYSPTQKGSVAFAEKQLKPYQSLLETEHFYPITSAYDAASLSATDKVGVTVAIENASGLCEEDEKLDLAFQRLESMLEICEHLFYISFTHHPENRFGGGNFSDNVGLKPDGETLLDYMNGRKIAVDLSHSSDNLAHGIIDYITKHSLDIPIMASHSNFRKHCDHVRNLPNELAQAIVSRNGLIGMNFLRDYVHPTQPEQLFEHILYGLQADVAQDSLAFGADFFDTKILSQMMPDSVPFFFPEHENASKYPNLLKTLQDKNVDEARLQKLSYQNAIDFMKRFW